MQDFLENWIKLKKTYEGEIGELAGRMRLFFMGNNLVPEIVKRLSEELNNLDNTI